MRMPLKIKGDPTEVKARIPLREFKVIVQNYT
jgi:hypothetical protein